MTDQTPIEFEKYLEAKYAVDSRSIDQQTFAEFVRILHTQKNPVLVDLGTGTGAMIRRILSAYVPHGSHFVGVDVSQDNLSAATAMVEQSLRKAGFEVRSGSKNELLAEKPGNRVMADMIRGDLFDECVQDRLAAAHPTAVSAHAFMDLVPLHPAVDFIARILRPGGVLYMSLNYDGVTSLFPAYENPQFESRLLKVYDRSMDDRTLRGSPTGGSRTGRTLYDVCVAHGLEVVGIGPSDWTVFPWNGVYRDGEEMFLLAVLAMMYQEGLRHDELERTEMDRWYEHRLNAVFGSTLALITHQLDVLACHPR